MSILEKLWYEYYTIQKCSGNKTRVLPFAFKILVGKCHLSQYVVCRMLQWCIFIGLKKELQAISLLGYFLDR